MSIPIEDTYDIYTIRLKTIDFLTSHHYVTRLTDEKIEFKLKNSFISSGNPGYGWAFNLMRDGNIIIDKQLKSIEVAWMVKLEILYFIAFCLSIISGAFTFLFFRSQIDACIVVSLVVFVLLLILGVLFLNEKIKAIILKCIYYNQN